MKLNIINLGLIFTLVLAAGLRLWNISGVPPSVSMDEASIAWNAYSVLKTGGDEFGEFPFPSQRGYDDWRRSTYLLLVVPFVALFGLGPLAVRLPSIILSLVAVLATYRICIVLFAKNKQFARSIGLISSLLVAISPWHVYVSRIGHESNTYLSFFIFGVWFLLEALSKFKHVIVTIIFFSLSVVSYYAGQVLVPIFLPVIVFLYRKELFRGAAKNKTVLVSIIILALGMVPLIFSVFSPSAIIRFKGTSTFNPDQHYEEVRIRDQKRQQALKRGDRIAAIVYSQRLFPLKVFIDGYVSHFRPAWLFRNTGNEPFKAPKTGLLYLWQLPFIIIGILVLLRSTSFDTKSRAFLFAWIILAALPGSIATGAPHAMRTFPFAVAWQIVTAVGIISTIAIARQYKKIASILVILVAAPGFFAFVNNYFVVFPLVQSRSFHYAFSRMMPFVLSRRDQYERIVFSNEDNLYQSYMVFLYYSRFNPFQYQKLGGTKSGGYAQTHAFDKYEFRPIRKDETLAPGTLYIGNTKDFPGGTKPLAAFANLDGTIAIVAVSAP